MTGYLVSLFMGFVVGAAYGLVHVRSPAPPMIALAGLFGMVLGGSKPSTWPSAVSCHRPRPPSSALWSNDIQTIELKSQDHFP
jgi:XapX domain-containing protein